MIKSLLKKRLLDSFRLMSKYHLIAVDGVHLYNFPNKHCENCLVKKTKNGKLQYYHMVLEAKIVCSNNMALSAQSEFIENTDLQASKQDCESKAFKRLTKNIKKAYPKLPICILLDGLYANGSTFFLCAKYGYQYITVLKDGSLKSVNQEFKSLAPLNKRNNIVVKDLKESSIQRDIKWANNIEYVDQQNRQHMINVVECIQTDKVTGKKNCFRYATSLTINKQNAPDIVQAGRDRWKIENEGFNVQKNHDLNLEHCFSENTNGYKAFYLLLQMACILFALIEKGNLLKKGLKKILKTAINLAKQMLETWRNDLLSKEKLHVFSNTRWAIHINSS